MDKINTQDFAKKSNIAIGNRLKELREAKGYSLRYVASRLNKSHSTINFYEIGRQEPSLSTLKKLCAIYDYDMMQLLQDVYDVL